MTQGVGVDPIRTEVFQHAPDNTFACADAACQPNDVLIFPFSQGAPEFDEIIIIVFTASCVVKPPGIMKNANTLL
jgi:hypothetical protein